MNDMIRLRGRATSARAWMIASGSSDVTPLISGSAPDGLERVALHEGHHSGRLPASRPNTTGQRGVGSVICALYSFNFGAGAPQFVMPPHSHSIVAGGLLLMSYTTRLTPCTSLMIRVLILPSTS